MNHDFRKASYVSCIATSLFASGCATDQSGPPAVQIQTVTHTVEVQRPCAVTKPVRPAPLARPLPDDMGRLLALVSGKLAEWSGPGGYGERAEAAIGTCTKVNP